MKYFLFTLFLIISFLSDAQILRIDHKSVGRDSLAGWKGDLELDFLLNNLKSTADEQINFIGLKFLTNLSYFTSNHQVYSKNELMYFKGQSEEFLNRGFSYLRINWNRQKQWHPETVGQVQFDNIRHLEFRWLAVQYLKWVSRQDEDHEFDLGVGPMFEHEEWSDFTKENQRVFKDLVKLSAYVGWYAAFSEKVNLSWYQIYQVGWDENEQLWRNRLSSDLQLRDHLSDRIDLIIRFTAAYDAQPIIPVARYIYELSNGIVFRF